MPADLSPRLDALMSRSRSWRERRDLATASKLRKQLEGSTEVIGDVFEAQGGGLQTTVGQETKEASSRGPEALFLYRIVRELEPSRVVEFGSALGVSGTFIAMALRANGRGALTTIEGSPSRHEVAKRSIGGTVPEVELQAVNAYFDDRFDLLDGADLLFIDGNHQVDPTRLYVHEAVERMGRPAVLVLDDCVSWSPEMSELWSELAADDRFTGSGQIEELGILVLGDSPLLSA